MDAITGLDGLLKLRCKNKRSLLGKPCLKVPPQVRAGSVAASSLVHPPSSQVTLPPPFSPFLLQTLSSSPSPLAEVSYHPPSEAQVDMSVLYDTI